MKRQVSLFLAIILTFVTPLFAQKYSSDFKKSDVLEVCDKVVDWQIEHFSEINEHHELDWLGATLYRGMMEWDKVNPKSGAFEFVYKIGAKHDWGTWNKYTTYHADDICIAQSYIEIYRKTKERRTIQAVLEKGYYVATHPSEVPVDRTHPLALERWSWCDALFMAPPVYAALYKETGDKVFLDYLNNEYKASLDSLYDKEEKLFYRDIFRKPLKEKNGAKQFWGRGNGWVFGGLPLVIENLPYNSPDRVFYIDLFREMAERIIELQMKDGSWRASLLDPKSHKNPENSASAFFCYGIAWGIRNGVISYRHMPALKKAWSSLVSAVHADGKLGYVQAPGDAPEAVNYESTAVYGVGAFLLAGSEIYKMSK